jgi:hypothetical protein
VYQTYFNHFILKYANFVIFISNNKLEKVDQKLFSKGVFEYPVTLQNVFGDITVCESTNKQHATRKDVIQHFLSYKIHV